MCLKDTTQRASSLGSARGQIERFERTYQKIKVGKIYINELKK